MHTSISKIVAFGLLASTPLTSAYVIPSEAQELSKKDEGSLSWVRSVLPLAERHHTAAQIAVSISDATIEHN